MPRLTTKKARFGWILQPSDSHRVMEKCVYFKKLSTILTLLLVGRDSNQICMNFDSSKIWIQHGWSCLKSGSLYGAGSCGMQHPWGRSLCRFEEISLRQRTCLVVLWSVCMTWKALYWKQGLYYWEPIPGYPGGK